MIDYDNYVAEKQAWFSEKKEIIKTANEAISALQKQVGMTSQERKYDNEGNRKIKQWQKIMRGENV
jgi:hypothetical protein